MSRGRRAVHFFMHSEDLVEFDRWLNERNDTVVLKTWSRSEHPEILPSVHSGEDFQVLLALRAELPSLRVAHFVIGRGYFFDSERGPVLQFNRGLLNGRVLRGGSLVGSTGYWGYVPGAKTWTWVEKPAVVVQWMEAIVRRVRRACAARHNRRYVAPHALEWKSSGNGDFAAF